MRPKQTNNKPPYAAGIACQSMLRSVLLVVLTGLPFVPAYSLDAPAFYYTVRTGSSSDYLPGYDITLESNRYSFLRDFPSSEILDEIDWASSSSFARNYIVGYTTGGKVYQLRGWDSGTLDVEEYDPVTLQPIGASTSISADLMSFTSASQAFMNPGIVYWFNAQTDPFFDNDSGWESYVLETGERRFLAAEPCGVFMAGDGMLYCATVTDATGSQNLKGTNIEFKKLDAVTGELSNHLGSWTFPTAVASNGWHFAVAKYGIFAARKNSGSTELWVFRVDDFLADPATAAPALVTGWSSDQSISDMDAEGGVVMVHYAVGNTAVLYDMVSGGIETYQTAKQAQYSLHFLVQQVPESPLPSGGAGPAGTASDGTNSGSADDPTSGGSSFGPLALFGSMLILRQRRKRR